MSSLLTILTTLLVVCGGVNGFGAGIKSTRCNLDSNRGEVSDPCGSLYDAVCAGNYCRCPTGHKEDPFLKRCVRGSDDQSSQRGESDLFDDLPFDYQPPGQSSTQRPRQPASYGVGNTRCSASNDPCRSLYNAMCGSGGYCFCPSGTTENSALVRCDPIARRSRPQQEDEDDDNSLFKFSLSGASTLRMNPLSASVVAVVMLAFRNM